MARFPFFGFPYQYPYYNRYYNYNNYNSINKEINEDKEENDSSVQAEEESLDRFHSKKSSKNNQFLPLSFNFNGFSDCENPIIEILGIQLFLDDIIILALIFLLYKEGVKDEMLFIALILLLLS